MIHVVFVCLGNICRSPVAQSIFAARVATCGLAELISIDSCGTAAFNVGKAPDPRAKAAALRAGYNLEGQIARQVSDADFDADYLIAMDRSNLTILQGWAPAECRAELALLLSYGDHAGETQVPDPYYQDPEQFDTVVATLEKASDAFLDHICRHHRLP